MGRKQDQTLQRVLLGIGLLSLGTAAAFIFGGKKNFSDHEELQPDASKKRAHSEHSSPEQTKRIRTRDDPKADVPLEKDVQSKKLADKAAKVADTLPKNGPVNEGPQAEHSVRESFMKTIPPQEDSIGQASLASQGGGDKQKPSESDISALMASKHAVPDTDQGDPEKLGKHYGKMAFKFENDGLNLKAVEDSRKWFNVDDGKATPKEYMNFETPLARGAVRLGVFRLDNENSDSLRDEASKATDKVVEVLPRGTVVHKNLEEHYHVTVQMISHPSDPRPNTNVKGGGLAKDQNLKWIPAPSPSNLQSELDLYKKTAAKYGKPQLQIHSIVFADSGALLLLFTDQSGIVQKLRSELRDALPGANEKQPTILHVTLARVLNADKMSLDQRLRIVGACSEQTERLKGLKFQPDALWHTQENTFTLVNVDASSLKCPFK